MGDLNEPVLDNQNADVRAAEERELAPLFLPFARTGMRFQEGLSMTRDRLSGREVSLLSRS